MTPRLRLGDVAGGTRTARVGGGIPGEVGYGPSREEAVGWGLGQDPLCLRSPGAVLPSPLVSPQILGLTFAMTMYCQVVKADTYCA